MDSGLNRARTLMIPAALVLCSVTLFAQWAQNPTTGSNPEQLSDRTKIAGMTGLDPELKAGFVDKGSNAKEHKAVVRADVWGVDLVSSQSGTEAASTGAFLSYVLDHNPPIRTDQKEYTFDNLAPGQHTITVRLLSADGQTIGSNVVMGIHIPK